jgi:hypothetical protein
VSGRGWPVSLFRETPGQRHRQRGQPEAPKAMVSTKVSLWTGRWKSVPDSFERKPPSTELSPETLHCLDTLFLPEDRGRAQAMLYEGFNTKVREADRCRMAALKCSDGNLLKLEQAIRLGRTDFRDLLMAAGFGHDVTAHFKWMPKPASEPAEIDPVSLAAGIHVRIGAVLSPIGFGRHGDEWSRDGEVTQRLRLLTGLTSRVETRFFLRLSIESKPVAVMLQLPRLPRGMGAFSWEQGYIFRARDREDPLYASAAADVERYARPWFERFTTSAEVQRGFEDGTFKPYLKIEGQAVIF